MTLPRGLILGIQTIPDSNNPYIIRSRQVLKEPTDEQIQSIAITADTIQQSLIATVAVLSAKEVSKVPASSREALKVAYKQGRVLSGKIADELARNFSSALIIFLEKHSFKLKPEVQQLLTHPYGLNHYVSYTDIARILTNAQIPVYYISDQIGPEFHYTWVT